MESLSSDLTEFSDILVLSPNILYIIFNHLKLWHFILTKVNKQWRSIILKMNANKLPITNESNIKLLSTSLLKWAKLNGYYWNKNTCANAAESGNLEVLMYLHENKCPWSKLSCENAAKNGHLEVLKYLHENGCL